MTAMEVEQNNDPMIPTTGTGQVTIPSGHQDYLHCVKFDVYGRRIATCSGDRVVKVFELKASGEWVLTSQWQAHKSQVTCLDWAHPEFGSILATCGSDHQAKIWEEQQSPTTLALGAGAAATTASASAASTTTTGGGGGASSVATVTASRWVLRASLTEARRGVTCVAFCPRYWGLKLAVGSSDGCVRIYEAIDIMNLTQWPLAATLQSFAEGNHNKGCTSLSWSTGRFEAPTLVAAGSHCVLYRYTKHSASGTQAWYPLLKLPFPGGVGDKIGDVLSVAWAPNVGRRFHYIASAEDSQLRIYKLSRELVPPASSGGGNVSGAATSREGGAVPTVLHTQTIPTPAWRVQWNVTGTVLASSGDGGKVQLWKMNGSDGEFECVSEVHGDGKDGTPMMDTA